MILINFYFVYGLIVLLLCSGYCESTSDTDVCKDGTCLPLSACAVYKNLLKHYETFLEGQKLVEERKCGFQNNNVKVCCPLPDLSSTTEAPTTNDEDFVEALPQPGQCADADIETDIEVYLLKASARSSRSIRNITDIIPEQDFTVYNGFPVVSRGKARWMALLGYKNSAVFWQCGGSLITERHVLTAAHCIKPSLYLVRLGEIDLSQEERDASPVDILVKKAIAHENYSKFHNDIGIVVLQSSIDFAYTSHIAPVCLPTPQQQADVVNTKTAFVTGWGETEMEGRRPERLLHVFVNILERDHCARAYNSSGIKVTIDERVLCAGDALNEKDACNGDSGGPLVTTFNQTRSIYYYQVGIVSFGFRCSHRRFAGVYTNIQHFMPWIMEKVVGKPVQGG